MTPDGRDILIGHTTWSALENMQRIVKRFDMPLPGAQGGAPVPGRYVATSSYPGYAMYSSDDFYVMSSGIVSQGARRWAEAWGVAWGVWFAALALAADALLCGGFDVIAVRHGAAPPHRRT